MRRVPLLTGLLVLASASGCGRSENEAAPPEQRGQDQGKAPEKTSAEIDRLRALPYAGYAPGEADEEQDGVVMHDAQRSYPGFNLYVIHRRSAAELIDAEGRIIRRWEYQPSQLWGNGELLPNGDFLVVGADPDELPEPAVADDSRYILRFNWMGELLWRRELTAHHDIELTPRNQLLTLTFARRIIPAIDPALPVRDDRLTLLSHSGEVLETLSLYDVLSARPQVFQMARVGPNDTGGERWIDLFHCNSVEWMHHKHLEGKHPIYGPSNVLICFRHQNRVAIVDWDKKEVLWAWGGHELSGPHDAQVLENGNILVFDNGMERRWSRVIELDPLRRTVVWQYQTADPHDFFTMSKGANQRLPNGNTLITNSDHGHAFEVTRAGEVVWEFRCPYKNEAGQRATIVRMKRYERAYLERIQAQVGQSGAKPTP
jgi:hypothetical protein